MNLVGSLEQMTLGFQDTWNKIPKRVRYIRFQSEFPIGFSKLIVRNEKGLNIADGKKITTNSLCRGSLQNVLDENGNNDSYFFTCSETDIPKNGSGMGLDEKSDMGMFGVSYKKADARRDYSSYGDSIVEIDLGGLYDISSIEIIKPDWRMMYAKFETMGNGGLLLTSTESLHHLISVGLAISKQTGSFKPIPIQMKSVYFDSIKIPYPNLTNPSNGLNLVRTSKIRRRLLELVDWKNVNIGTKYNVLSQ